MFNYSHLKYPPITPNKHPNFYISRMKNLEYDNVRVYGAVSQTDGKLYAQVGCTPERTFRNGQPVNSLYIESLYSDIPNSGAGSYLMRFMKNLSKQLGCEGRIHLMASSATEPDRVPHLFYYKIGMNTGNEEIDKKLAKFAKSGKNANHNDFSTMMMYYPPIEYKKPKTVLEHLSNFVIYMIQQTFSMDLKFKTP